MASGQHCARIASAPHEMSAKEGGPTKIRDVALASSAIILCLAATNHVKVASCESLANVSLDHATVTAATSVPEVILLANSLTQLANPSVHPSDEAIAS